MCVFIYQIFFFYDSNDWLREEMYGGGGFEFLLFFPLHAASDGG